MHSLKWYFLVILLLAFGSEAQITEADKSMQAGLEEKLSNLLKTLRDVSLRLRNYEDTFNTFMHFFLKQTVCPVNVFLNFTAERINNRNNVILTNVTEFGNLIAIYSSRLGTQFYIFEQTFKPTAVVEVSRSVWNRWGIFKNYYITSGNIYFYNPFAVAGPQTYGALQNATGERDFHEILHNLNGYPVRTYIFRSVYANLVYNQLTGEIEFAEGVDAKVAYAIGKAMNCKLILQDPDDEFFGHRLENGSFDGAIGRTLRYEADLTMTGFFLKDYLTRDIDFSVSVYMDKLCCYVSKAKRIPQSILPLFSVKMDMWLGFIGAAFVWAVIWSLIRKCNLWIIRNESMPIPPKITRTYQYARILIDTWVIWVRVNISRYPPFPSEKVFVISLCLVSVIFGAIFESSLATVYINPLYYKDINTLQELDESRFKILIKHAAMKDDLFYGTNTPMFQRLDNRLLYVHEMENRVIEIMSHRGGFASVTRASSLILDDISYILGKTIHQIPECPKNYHIAYVLPKESPFRQRVDNLLLRFLNAGLIDYWIEIMYHKARIGILQSPEILKVIGGDRWKVLTIVDLQLAFYVIMLGSLLATIVLISEILFAIYMRRKCEQNQ